MEQSIALTYYLNNKNMISKSGQQESKPEQPKQEFTFYGYRRQNHYDYVSTSSQVIIRYNIYPIGLAKMQYLRTKVQMILGKEQMFNQYMEINLFFKYAIKRIMFFEAISAIKKTNYFQILVNQLAEGMSKQEEKKIQEFVEQVLQDIKDEQQAKTKAKEKEKEKKEVQIKSKELEKTQQQFNRLQKLMNYEKSMLELKQNIKQQFMNKQKQKQQIMKLSLQIDEKLRNIDNLQNLKVSQSFLKYSIFQKRYKGYYDIQLKLERRDAKPYFVIRINRLSKQIEPVLQNMIAIIEQKDKEVSYTPQMKVLIKDIFGQIKRFQNANSTENKNYYSELGPETVIFDQIALTPKLSYEPLLLNVFGLKNRPMSAENRLCFHPSPRGLDYFKSLPEYDEYINCMLNDPLYGNKQIYQNDMHRLSTLDKKKIQTQQQFLSLKLQQIVVWRMILLSYYLSNSKEYGLSEQMFFKKKQQHHKSKLQFLQKEVKEDCSKLYNYLGIQENPNNMGKFEFSMSRLSDFLQPQKQNDSVIQKYKDTNIKKYFQLRNDLIKQMIRLLVNDCLFGKVYNVKKYITIYLILAIEIFQEYNYLVCLENKESKDARKVDVLIKNRKYFKGFLEGQIKRLKGDKTHISYQLSTYNKIIQYGQARKNTDAQAKYIKQDEIGKILFQYIKQLHVQLRLFHRLNDILNQLQLRELLTSEDIKQYEEISNDIKSVAFRSLKLNKAVLGQFLYNQLKLKHREGPHKIPNEASNQIRQFFSQSTERLDLITLIYLNFDESRLISYDTLILPQFNLEQNDRKVQIPKNFDFLPNQAGKLNLVGQLIEIGRLQPKKMAYLVNKGESLFQQIGRGKKQPLYIEKIGKMI